MDLQRDLFAKAHNAGARVHLNAWGCKVPAGEAAEYCNYYGSDAADMDAFMHANPESLVDTAVGDAGGHILKSRCFVNLYSKYTRVLMFLKFINVGRARSLRNGSKPSHKQEWNQRRRDRFVE